MSDQVKGAAHWNEDTFQDNLDKANKSGKPVMVDFFATWCGPCKLAAPVIDKLADEMKDSIEVVKVDVDENNGIASRFGVMSIPTVIIFDTDGKEAAKQIGYPGEQGYRNMIAQVVGK